MASSHVRLPEDWRRFDRTGLFGALIFPLLLAGLWSLGLTPTTFVDCAFKPQQLEILSDAGKVSLTGLVSSETERKALVDAAASAYGRGGVVDKLTVDGSVRPLGWRADGAGLFRRLKTVGEPVSVKVAGATAVVAGVAADAAARDSMATELAAVLADKTTLANQLSVRPSPAPKPAAAAPVVPPAIAAGTLGRHRLPDGTEIMIAGGGLESKVLAFLDDKARAIDNGLWFDFDRLRFETGSTNLTAESRAQIETVVAILKAYPNAAIKIGGYTDNVGDPEANVRLSAARAERVAGELVSQGVAADRIEAAGYGDQHPVASNDTAEGRAQNRRTALSVRRR